MNLQPDVSSSAPAANTDASGQDELSAAVP
jgi:hypothetical protein